MKVKRTKNGKASTTIERAALLASALGDPTRLRLLSLILHHPDICVCDLEAVTKLPQTKISKHLAVLRNAELVTQRREGTWMHYSLRKPQSGIQKGLLGILREAHKTVPELHRDMLCMKSSECRVPERAGSRLVQVAL
jgi:ArsR family transcriptional regulator